MTLLEEVSKDYTDAKEGKKKRKPRVKLKKEKNIKNRIMLTVFFVGLAITGVFYIAESYVDWRESHEWQFPARWIGFVREIEKKVIDPIEKAEAKEQEKELTDMEIIEQYHLAPVLRSVYFLESTSGQNDYCKDEGMVNGYGFRQNFYESKCFNHFSYVTERVNEWFEERLSSNGNNLVEAVCYYNTGVPDMSVCDYSEKFVSVLADNF